MKTILYDFCFCAKILDSSGAGACVSPLVSVKPKMVVF